MSRGSRRKSLFLAQKLSRVVGFNLEMTDSNPTAFLSFHFHFQRTGSDKRDTNALGLLPDLRQQRTTKATANARRTNFLTLALALARRSARETLFFLLRVLG
jgi:hypothetical protein